MMSNLGRLRGDLWQDSLTVLASEAFFNYQVYNQAIVVPETIGALRALTGIESKAAASIAMTDRALGIAGEFLVRAPGRGLD